MVSPGVIEKVVAFTKDNLRLEDAQLGSEYYYRHLSVCVIDAVFSLGIKYDTVRNVVTNYCSYFSITPFRIRSNAIPPLDQQESISDLVGHYDSKHMHIVARDVYKNLCRTSSSSGILKAEAVLLFAMALVKHGVTYFQDVPKLRGNEMARHDIQRIPGQRSGKSYIYFLMLSGDDDLITPGRQIERFLYKATGVRNSMSESQSILRQTAALLTTEYPNLTPRLLDFKIWEWQREQTET